MASPVKFRYRVWPLASASFLTVFSIAKLNKNVKTF
nr:MAG TPA: hypothetical protein [Caudoviricetes sp.]